MHQADPKPSMARIPLKTFHDICKHHVTGGWFSRLRPDQYYACAEAFCAALQTGSSPKSIRLPNRMP